MSIAGKHREALAVQLGSGKAVLELVVGTESADESDAVRETAARFMRVSIAAAATALDLPSASFDVVLCWSLERFDEPAALLLDVKRVLRARGLVALAARNRAAGGDGLSFLELRALLGAFGDVRIAGQRALHASALHPLRGTAHAVTWYTPVPGPSLPALPEPDAFVALCSAEAGTALPELASLYADPDVRGASDDAIAELAERAAGLAAEVGRARRAFAHLNGGGAAAFEAAELRAERETLRAAVDELGEQLRERDARLAALAAQAAQARAREREAERRVAQYALERMNYEEAMERATIAEAALRDMLGSRSWRMTAPVRRIMNKVRASDGADPV